MDEIQLSDLPVLNIEKEFSENLDFNGVVDTFAKMRNRRNSLCSGPSRPITCVQLSIAICDLNNCCIIKYVTVKCLQNLLLMKSLTMFLYRVGVLLTQI